MKPASTGPQIPAKFVLKIVVRTSRFSKYIIGITEVLPDQTRHDGVLVGKASSIPYAGVGLVVLSTNLLTKYNSSTLWKVNHLQSQLHDSRDTAGGRHCRADKPDLFCGEPHPSGRARRNVMVVDLVKNHSPINNQENQISDVDSPIFFVSNRPRKWVPTSPKENFFFACAPTDCRRAFGSVPAPVTPQACIFSRVIEHGRLYFCAISCSTLWVLSAM